MSASICRSWRHGLRGRRIVTVWEVLERGEWDTSTLNPLISGEEIEANRMHRNSVHFNSQAHLIFMGNHQPSASAASGIWRRLCLIQFRYVPADPNPRLKAD